MCATPLCGLLSPFFFFFKGRSFIREEENKDFFVHFKNSQAVKKKRVLGKF
jgi:hypothetical protein